MDIQHHTPAAGLPLPPYRAVLAVDAEKFSRNTDLGYQVLGTAIPSVLATAFNRSGLAHIWDEARFARHSGDGYVLGAEPRHLPALIHPFLDTLHNELRALQPQLAAIDRNLRLRLRVSLDVGPLPDTRGASAVDAMGEAMVQVHRLLDSSPVRQALADSHPDTTLLAAIVSRRVYEDAVLSGLGSVHPSRFRPVNVTLPEKEYTSEGYLFVPVPSHGTPEEPRGSSTEDTRDSGHPAATPAPGATTFTNSGNAENIIQSTTFNGGIRSVARRERP